jgi:hypothetical protein
MGIGRIWAILREECHQKNIKAADKVIREIDKIEARARAERGLKKLSGEFEGEMQDALAGGIRRR